MHVQQQQSDNVSLLAVHVHSIPAHVVGGLERPIAAVAARLYEQVGQRCIFGKVIGRCVVRQQSYNGPLLAVHVHSIPACTAGGRERSDAAVVRRSFKQAGRRCVGGRATGRCVVRQQSEGVGDASQPGTGHG